MTCKIKLLIIVLAVIFCGSNLSVFASTDILKTDWEEYKSDHFIVSYHSSVSGRYIREFTRKCESYYHGIAERLGFKRFDFWTWENRARVSVYGSKQDYVSSSGRAQWSAASVHVAQKSISTYYFAEDFFDKYLPHELTHIVLREFAGINVVLPLWFEEGVACANEDNCYLRYLLVAKGFADKQESFTIAQLEKMGAGALREPKKFYSISAATVIFLLEDYSKDDFVRFLREIRDGSSFYQAMNKIYRIQDAQALNDKFQAFLSRKSYEEIATSQSVNW